MNKISIKEVLSWGQAEIAKQNISTAKLDAEVLLAHVLNLSSIDLYLQRDKQLSAVSIDAFNSLIARRVRREPVAYIIGYKEFWSKQIKVNTSVLIPRPETEGIVEIYLKLNSLNSWPQDIKILDLCTGSGCIAAALATEFPESNITATDISEKALAVARENLAFAEGRVIFFNGNLFEPFYAVRRTPYAVRKFDLIVSNPPYVSKTLWDDLAQDIKEYEPRQALVADSQGLAICMKILEEGWKYLKPSAALIMEIGIGQAAELKESARVLGKYKSIEVHKDLAGIERYLICSTAYSVRRTA